MVISKNKITRITHWFDPIYYPYQPEPMHYHFDPFLFVTEDSFRSIQDVGDNLEQLDTFVEQMTYYYYSPQSGVKNASVDVYTYTEMISKLIGKIKNTTLAQDPVTGETWTISGNYGSLEGIARSILVNHVVDICIKNYYKYTLGIMISETSFPIEGEAGKHFISSLAIDKKDDLFGPDILGASNLSFDSSHFENIVDVNSRFVNDYQSFIENMNLSEIEENLLYTDFSAWAQSSLIGAESNLVDSITPKVFDRVFCIFFNVSQTLFDVTNEPGIVNDSSLEPVLNMPSNTNAGQYFAENLYSIKMTEDMDPTGANQGRINELYNDNVSVNFFTVSTIGKPTQVTN